MGKFYTFPHYTIHIKDESLQEPLVVEELPLHRPMFLSIAERGVVGKPFWGGYADIKKEFGEGTLDPYSKYFGHQNVFLREALKNQKVFFVRLAPADAQAAALVLECSVQETQVQMWETDAGTGQRLTDANGDWIPVMDSVTNTPVTELGTVVTWNIRALASGEDPSVLTPTVTPDPNGDITTYPIFVFIAKSPGEFGNKVGVKFWWDTDGDIGMMEEIQSLVFKIAFVDTPYGFDTTLPVYNFYGYPDADFSFKVDAIDPSTKKRYYIDDIVANEYTDLPVQVISYASNIETIGNTCLSHEDLVKFSELTSPYMVNLFTGMTMNNISYYDHIVVGGPSTDPMLAGPNPNSIINKEIVQFLIGGSDGTIDATTVDQLAKEYLIGGVYPDIVDESRYPITHLYDSGFATDVKETMIDFMSLREDVKIILSTQAVCDPINDKSQDISLGSYLRSRVMLNPECYIFGTDVIRATIFSQTGQLTNDVAYTKPVPATIDNLVKRCKYHGATYVKGKPKGLPRSAVTILKNINWFPTQDDFKQLSWDNSINYMQYYDMTGYHYPDVISVYPYKASLLSDDLFVDYLIYIKHIVRFEWAKLAGMDDPMSKLIGIVRDSVTRSIQVPLGNYIRFEVNPYQTSLDAQLGYAMTIEIPVYGTIPKRVANVIIPVRREVQ